MITAPKSSDGKFAPAIAGVRRGQDVAEGQTQHREDDTRSDGAEGEYLPEPRERGDEYDHGGRQQHQVRHECAGFLQPMCHAQQESANQHPRRQGQHHGQHNLGGDGRRAHLERPVHESSQKRHQGGDKHY